MNKIIVLLVAAVFSLQYSFSQNLLEKIPDNAAMVIKYSGENFSKNLTVKKMESYPFVKENLFKILQVDSLTSLENTGVNFEKDIYQYLQYSDSTLCFVSLIPLKDTSLFLKLLEARHPAELKPEKKNGFSFVTLADNNYVGWNNEYAMLIYSHYSNPNRYNYNYYSDTTVAVDTAFTMVDSAVNIPVDTIASIIEEDKVTEEPKNATSPKSKGKGINKKKTSGSKKNAQKETKKPPVVDEEVVIEEVKPDEEESTTTFTPYFDSAQQAKQEAWYKEQDKITAARQKKVSIDLLNTSYTGTTHSIGETETYKKIIDPAAHMSGWFNYEDVMKQYWGFLYSGIFSGMRYRSLGSYSLMDNAPSGNGIGLHSSMNVYFEKNKMRIDQKTISSGDMQGFEKDLYKSKQNKSIAKLVNPDNIGYFSASINTEAMAKFYYKWLKSYLGSQSYIGKYADLVNLYVDLLEIVIDEKAIAELMPGNYLFVLHGLKMKNVSYTDFTYDENFKSTEVTKTKQELSPDFTFAMETKNEAFMNRIANIPLKYAEDAKYNYKDKGGYFELVFDSGKNVLDKIYFVVKEGKVVVTTSKEVVDMVLQNSGYEVDGVTRKSILKNNYSFKINTKRLIQQLGPELNSGTSKQISNYLMENVGDLIMESSLKNGMIQGTTTMAINGNHANSFEFFFNMMDAINNIIKKDKEESEQKFN
ncbi:MAG: hypothetical protein JST81_02140 [Bacteroidetes bacterium]|nr:hypothetical protein [Bacteroidota bacterium]